MVMAVDDAVLIGVGIGAAVLIALIACACVSILFGLTLQCIVVYVTHNL